MMNKLEFCDKGPRKNRFKIVPLVVYRTLVTFCFYAF